MGIVLSTNFSYKGPLPLDTRLVFNTLAARDAYDTTALYEGIISYVKENKTRYEFIPNDSGVLAWSEFTGVESLTAVEEQEVIDTLK
jgi:hypothetical protein